MTSSLGRQAVLEVAGMTCAGCEGHVRSALEGAGASGASADWRRGIARFRWPESVGETALRGAVSEAGYQPGTLRVEEPGRPVWVCDDVDYDLLVVGAGSAAF